MYGFGRDAARRPGLRLIDHPASRGAQFGRGLPWPGRSGGHRSAARMAPAIDFGEWLGSRREGGWSSEGARSATGLGI